MLPKPFFFAFFFTFP
ncbi:hypothetical protein [Serratia quinivorans]|nr:hypothetical protein [Serratia quinivorans]